MNRALVVLLLATAAAACGPRRVEVSAAESGPAAVQLTVVNSLTQPVNIYVVYNGAETFVRQVSASTTESVPVRGVPVGATVSLRAAPASGSNSYRRDNVVLSSTYEWRVP